MISVIRFVVDESGFTDWAELGFAEIEAEMACLSDKISCAKASEIAVGVFSQYAGARVDEHRNLSDLFQEETIEADVRIRLHALMDKCVFWDEMQACPDDLATDPAIAGKGMECAFSVSFAARSCSEGHLVGCLQPCTSGRNGAFNVRLAGEDIEVCFIRDSQDQATFWQKVILAEAKTEDCFWRLSNLAFPNLVFAKNLSFRNFAGGYINKDLVTNHLSLLNARFAAEYVAQSGESRKIARNLGIELSLESPNTHKNKDAMKQRNVQFSGKTVKCEWHTKLQPHRNRIHFHPGNEDTGNRILIGIFTEHLDT